MLLSFGLIFVTGIILTPNTEGAVVQLHGAGASFPSEVYFRWIAAYKQYRADHVTLNMTYKSIGSGAGKQQIKGEKSSDPVITYAGSDITLTEEEQKRSPDLIAFPVMAGAVAIAFNMKDMEHLNLSIDALVGIYNGSIKSWNDSIIQELNPGYKLPGAEIIVLARTDKSGTTHSFTSALSSSRSSWQLEYGIFSEGLDADGSPVKWNKSVIDFYAYSSRGMSGLILSIPYSIGYTTVADIHNSHMKYALIQNSAGNFVQANTETVQNAIVDSKGSKSLLNPVGEFSYPIAAYTFFIIPRTQMTDCNSATEFVRYVDWFFTSKSAQSECEKLYMMPLEAQAAENLTKLVLKTITCRGKNVWEIFQAQKRLETEESESDFMAVYITISCLSAFGLICSIIFGRHGWIMYKSIINDTWYILFTDIHFEKENINKLRTQMNSRAFDLINNAVKSHSSEYAWQMVNIKVGVIDSDIIFLIKSDSEIKTNTFKSKKKLIWFRDAIDHVNVAKFLGLTRSSIRWFSIYKGQIRGSVTDISRNPAVKITTPGLIVLCKEIIHGMEYLHKKGIVHGNLRGSCCLVDITWKVKITDWHGVTFRSCTSSDDLSKFDFKSKTNDDDIIVLFWVAPEVIKFQRKLTNEADVYSFAIVLQELFSKNEPYNEILLAPKDIVTAVLTCCLRPKFSENTPPFIRSIMDKTWDMDPAGRPTFHALGQLMKSWYPNDSTLTDCIMQSVEEYASTLERQLSVSRKETEEANEASKAVMLENAPILVVESFLNNEKQKVVTYKAGTIMACSFANLSQFVELFNADDVIKILDELMTGIDKILSSSNMNKLSMNGENMLFASDPQTRSLAQVETISTFAITIMNFLERISSKTPAHYTLQMKIGIATGFVLVCVLGKKIPKYTLVGKAVTTAFEMLAAARLRTIRVCRRTHDTLKQRGALFETCILKTGLKEDDMHSYWLVSQQGLEGRFDPLISY